MHGDQVTTGAYSARNAHFSWAISECGEVSERDTGDDADHELLEQVDDR